MKTLLLAIFGALALLATGGTSEAGSILRTLTVDGSPRTYRLYIPENVHPSKTVPLVLVFHGRGGTAAGIEAATRFDAVADKNAFIVAYPNGVNRAWGEKCTSVQTSIRTSTSSER